MDVWLALAAAGAGYVAKHWKNANKGNENSSNVAPQSPTLTGHHIDKSSSPFSRLVPSLILEENSDDNNNDYTEDVGSMSSGHLENDLSQAITEELGLTDCTAENYGNSYNKPWKTESRLWYDFKKNKSSLSNLRMMQPLTSLDSCLLAQLYNEHAEMDEDVLSCFSSPSSPSVRPFIVTDGRKIIGREGINSFDLHSAARKNKLDKQMSLIENVIVYEVPSLPYNLSLEVPGSGSAKAKGLGGEFSSSVALGKHLSSLAGSNNGALLFGLGVAVGLVYSLLGNKREVDKLNGWLKQTESLVQDLQDELEMKDSLAVKELHAEEFESQGTNLESCDKTASWSFSAEQNSDGSFMNNGTSVFDQRRDGDLESMSKSKRS